MAKGDHLTVSFGVYQHHAIDMGDGRVIQYGGGESLMRDNEVFIGSYESLAAKGEVFVVEGKSSSEPTAESEKKNTQCVITTASTSLIGVEPVKPKVDKLTARLSASLPVLQS